MAKHGPTPNSEDVRYLHAAGVSRNEIARTLMCSTRQVDRVAAALGLTFDTTRTATAVEALAAQAEIERARLAATLRKLAQEVLPMATNEELPLSDRRHYLKVLATALDKDVRIAQLATMCRAAQKDVVDVKTAINEAFSTLVNTPDDELI